MLFRVAATVVMLSALFGGALRAEEVKTQKVIYPDGRVVYEPIPCAKAAHQPSTSTTSTSEGTKKDLSCCQSCNDPKCNGCPPGVNKPVITSSGGLDCKGEDCISIEPPVVGKLECVKDKIPFYVRCVQFRAHVPVPVLICRETETIEFKTVDVVAEPCCKFRVCVPCRKCVKCEKTCELRSKEADLRICIRPNGNIDIYVLNVPGMPTEWLLVNDFGLAGAASELGIQTEELQKAVN